MTKSIICSPIRPLRSQGYITVWRWNCFRTIGVVRWPSHSPSQHCYSSVSIELDRSWNNIDRVGDNLTCGTPLLNTWKKRENLIVAAFSWLPFMNYGNRYCHPMKVCFIVLTRLAWPSYWIISSVILVGGSSYSSKVFPEDPK